MKGAAIPGIPALRRAQQSADGKATLKQARTRYHLPKRCTQVAAALLLQPNGKFGCITPEDANVVLTNLRMTIEEFTYIAEHSGGQLEAAEKRKAADDGTDEKSEEEDNVARRERMEDWDADEEELAADLEQIRAEKKIQETGLVGQVYTLDHRFVPFRYTNKVCYDLVYRYFEYTTGLRLPFGKTCPPVSWVRMAHFALDPEDALGLLVNDSQAAFTAGGVPLLLICYRARLGGEGYDRNEDEKVNLQVVKSQLTGEEGKNLLTVLRQLVRLDKANSRAVCALASLTTTKLRIEDELQNLLSIQNSIGGSVVVNNKMLELKKIRDSLHACTTMDETTYLRILFGFFGIVYDKIGQVTPADHIAIAKPEVAWTISYLKQELKLANDDPQKISILRNMVADHFFLCDAPGEGGAFKVIKTAVIGAEHETLMCIFGEKLAAILLEGVMLSREGRVSTKTVHSRVSAGFSRINFSRGEWTDSLSQAVCDELKGIMGAADATDEQMEAFLKERFIMPDSPTRLRFGSPVDDADEGEDMDDEFLVTSDTDTLEDPALSKSRPVGSPYGIFFHTSQSKPFNDGIPAVPLDSVEPRRTFMIEDNKVVMSSLVRFVEGPVETEETAERVKEMQDRLSVEMKRDLTAQNIINNLQPIGLGVGYGRGGNRRRVVPQFWYSLKTHMHEQLNPPTSIWNIFKKDGPKTKEAVVYSYISNPNTLDASLYGICSRNYVDDVSSATNFFLGCDLRHLNVKTACNTTLTQITAMVTLLLIECMTDQVATVVFSNRYLKDARPDRKTFAVVADIQISYAGAPAKTEVRPDYETDREVLALQALDDVEVQDHSLLLTRVLGNITKANFLLISFLLAFFADIPLEFSKKYPSATFQVASWSCQDEGHVDYYLTGQQHLVVLEDLGLNFHKSLQSLSEAIDQAACSLGYVVDYSAIQARLALNLGPDVSKSLSSTAKNMHLTAVNVIKAAKTAVDEAKAVAGNSLIFQQEDGVIRYKIASAMNLRLFDGGSLYDLLEKNSSDERYKTDVKSFLKRSSSKTSSSPVRRGIFG